MLKEVILESIEIVNFKGTKKEFIKFGKETHIEAANGVGKTTVLDAYTFCFFGKDSQDNKKFNILPLDKKNKMVKNKEAEVTTTIIEINGDEPEFKHVFKRGIRQIWATKKGSDTEEYTGNKTIYSYNGAPLKASEYEKKVSEIIGEKIFKILSNATYFNSMEKDERREILIQLAPDVTDEFVISKNKDFEVIKSDILNKRKSFDEYKNESRARVKKSKDELKLIPSRIDEVGRSIRDINEADLIEEKERLTAEIKSLEAILSEGGEDIEALKLKIKDRDNQILRLEDDLERNKKQIWSKLKQEKSKVDNEAEEFFSLINGLSSKNEKIEIEIGLKKEGLEQNKAYKKALYDKWDAEEAKQAPEVSDHETKCFNCSQDLPIEMLDDVKKKSKESFNIKKSEALKVIQHNGVETNNNIEQYEKDIAALEESLSKNKAILSDPNNSLKNEALIASVDKYSDITALYTKALEDSAEVLDIMKKISDTKAITFDKLTEDSESIDNKKKSEELVKKLRQELISCEQQLSFVIVNKESEKRIEELSNQQEQLSKDIAILERTEFLISLFEKTKMNLIEETVNTKFKYIEFRLFEDLNNGAQKPDCVAMVNGVPYNDANTAAKVNAGIDVINVLSEHFGIITPVFIDNRESVTELIDSNSQLISLIVNEKHKKLSVSIFE